MAKVTIEDISRQTGLSRGTVSRALNDRPDISAETKQRVLDACRRLKYSPSHAARSLATGRSFALAVLVDDLHSVLIASFLRGVLARAQSARYAVHIAELGSDPQQQVDAVRALVTERIDSVLVATAISLELTSVLREAIEQRPLVACSSLDGLPGDLLIPDQKESGRLVARYLLRNGNRELLYVHTPYPAADERLAGFHEVCLENGVPPTTVTIELAAEGPINQNAEKLILARLEHVRAIAAADDYLALALMTLCWQHGRKPGHDIAIIGQGNERLSTRIRPTLSTVDFSGEEIGRRAADIALQRLSKSRMDAPQTAYVAPILIARESTGNLD